jgi:16S rRNA (adenine1518-N6/adenine1519-N6)-dimethyltransferase
MTPSIAPKKRFSQNFLTDVATARRIVDVLGIEDGDTVIEIGPGTGALTRWLTESKAKRLIAVDVDQRAIEHCRQQPWAQRVEFVLADVRTLDPTTLLAGQRGLLIGNLPYNISSDLIFWFLEHRSSFRAAVVMLQKEVAQRLVARPGTKDYGILSVAMWQGAQADIAFQVKPGAFFPRPEVTSSVVHLVPREVQIPVAQAPFHSFVRAAFSQRRKVLSNALRTWAASRKVELVDSVVRLDRTRAEELSPEELALLHLRLTGAGS